MPDGTDSPDHAEMQRLDMGAIWLTAADIDYVTGVLAEREQTWEVFVKEAVIEWAAR